MNLEKIMESVEYIKSKVPFEIKVGVILGSGLGEIADTIENKIIIKYSEVPNMPTSTVKGHAGQFVFGTIHGKNVIMMQGRFHYYEGNLMEDLALPIYIMKQLGVDNLVVTNAAGGVNKNLNVGDFMIIKDHVNFAFDNPLIGQNDDRIGTRFPDVSTVYNKNLIKIALSEAKKINAELKQGTYVMMSGPCYETPAEIRMVRLLGGDAVGMSTVPEVIAAAHAGINVLGISCITNMAAGILDKPLNHEEVMETSNKIKNNFILLLQQIIKNI